MTIQTRLILALSSLALALVLGIVLLFQWRFDAGLVDYLNAQQQLRLAILADEMAERWREDPGWTELRAEPKRFFRLARRLPGHDGHGRDSASRDSASRDTYSRENDAGENHRHEHGKAQDASYGFDAPENAPIPPPPPAPVLLLDATGTPLISRGPINGALDVRVEIRVDGNIVGYVASPRFVEAENTVDRHFREAQLRSLWTVAAFSLLIAVAVAVLLARQITKPLRKLSLAAHGLTQQQYAIDVDDQRRDELGTLARDIRELARTLEQNAGARQRWFADISHELRTPLTVLIGEIDALVDGVRPLTPERMASLQQEVLHLQRLVEDLYVLARADIGALQYQKHDLDLGDLLRERVSAASSAFAVAGVAVTLDALPDGVVVHADEDRLQQLIDNLLANSARYTASGGRVRIGMKTAAQTAELLIEDSAPGVPDDALPRLFEHLYRIDDARTRSHGGAGLGLAICQRIVEAHGGSIRAAHSPLGGLRITVTLPLSAEEADA